MAGMEVPLEFQSLAPPFVGATAPIRNVAKPSPESFVFGFTYVSAVGSALKPKPGLLRMRPCGERLPRVSKPNFR